MKTIATIACSLLASLAAADDRPESAPAPTGHCPLCKIPNRAALMAGLAKSCPDDCAKLCCTGTEATFLVEGLVCTACTSKVRAALDRLDGVHVEAACHNTGQVRVKYDPARIDEAKIAAAIAAAGHKVTGRKISFAVEELTTEEDAKALEVALATTDGIKRITTTVSDDSQVTVIFDPATCTGAKVEKTIAAAGYQVSPGP